MASDSVLAQLDRHAEPGTEVLVEVNVAGEESKGGIRPAELGDFIDRCPVRVAGLMTMPPFSTEPEASRPAFARLAELAAEHGLDRLSMGYQPGLGGRGRGGGDDPAAGHGAVQVVKGGRLQGVSPRRRFRRWSRHNP